MKHMVQLTITLIIAVLALVPLATADVPHMINYQGRLTDSTGNPLDTTVSMVFTIYDVPAGGSAKWTETHPSVTVTGGLFNVILGAGTPPVPIADSVFNQPDRWLGITVGSDPPLEPRTRLVSVGYSHRVSTVDGASGGSISGNTSIQSDLGVSGNINLPTTTATTGIIKVGTYRFIHNYGTVNTFVGYDAGNLTMTGGYNAANGAGALSSNTTGYNNTANGAGALGSNTTGGNNTANGNLALLINTTGNCNTADGKDALFSNTTGHDNTANGFEALNSNTTGYGNTALGVSADVSSGDLHNATAIGYSAQVDASNKVRIGNTSVTSIGGQVGWSVFSDARMKTNVKESPLGLNLIIKLRPITYNSLFPGQEGITYTGLIAQEVEKVLQELGADFSGLDKPKNEDGYYQLRYAEFVVPLIKAVQEQQKIIEQLKAQVVTLLAQQSGSKGGSDKLASSK